MLVQLGVMGFDVIEPQGGDEAPGGMSDDNDLLMDCCEVFHHSGEVREIFGDVGDVMP